MNLKSREKDKLPNLNSEKAVINWFKKHITDDGSPYLLDKDQAKIVLDQHKNTLVTARAGSGKTRTIVAKIVFLLTYYKIKPESIIVFAFNRKAKTEINERLTKIAYQDKPLFKTTPRIATTFHAFAYLTLGGKKELRKKLLTEEKEAEFTSDLNPETKQFIARAEQQYPGQLNKLRSKIKSEKDLNIKNALLKKYQELELYHQKLKSKGLINFNQLMDLSKTALTKKKTKLKYIFVDEYQDFSLLFLEQIKALRTTCPAAHLLAVGDDWQAINRFAGSDIKYFTNFEKYFTENTKKLFIPTNYRSNKKIVKNANYFMSKALHDYQGCKSGNKKLKGKIYLKDINSPKANLDINQSTKIPLLLKRYLNYVVKIIINNPEKSVKILHRNNYLSFKDWSLGKFMSEISNILKNNYRYTDKDLELISYSTIHRSKGLEADIVILLEIDAEEFPGKDKTSGLFQIFGDDAKTIFEDEARLFYVALTRPKEKLYIITKTPKITKENRKLNFISYLNDEWINFI